MYLNTLCILHEYTTPGEVAVHGKSQTILLYVSTLGMQGP